MRGSFASVIFSLSSSYTNGAPKVPNVPNAPKVPNVPNAPKVPNVPKVLNVPKKNNIVYFLQ